MPRNSLVSSVYSVNIIKGEIRFSTRQYSGMNMNFREKQSKILILVMVPMFPENWKNLYNLLASLLSPINRAKYLLYRLLRGLNEIIFIKYYTGLKL